MATFKYNGEDERVFPTLAITVKAGDTFDAPADFVSANVTSVGKTTLTTPPPASIAPTVGE